jgi:hypothetical protein
MGVTSVLLAAAGLFALALALALEAGDALAFTLGMALGLAVAGTAGLLEGRDVWAWGLALAAPLLVAAGKAFWGRRSPHGERR